MNRAAWCGVLFYLAALCLVMGMALWSPWPLAAGITIAVGLAVYEWRRPPLGR